MPRSALAEFMRRTLSTVVECTITAAIRIRLPMRTSTIENPDSVLRSGAADFVQVLASLAAAVRSLPVVLMR
jgi:hypothetical protein